MSRSIPAGTIAVFVCIFLAALFSTPVKAIADSSRQQAQPGPPSAANASPTTIVVGFRGALFHERTLGFRNAMETLQRDDGVHTELVFNGWMDRQKAWRAVRNWLDTNGDTQLSEGEKQQARIILIGHSWGVPSEIAFARRLEQQNIPVELMIEIDNVAKPWLPDETVPANVKDVINFYQGQGLFLLRGSSKIARANSADTQVLGDIKMSYDSADLPQCKDYSFLLRALNRYHIAIECDPNLWSHIESLIRARVAPGASPSEKRSAS